MKFLFLCHSLSIGGIETYILRFTKWLARHHPEHKVHLVCKSGEFGSYKPEFQETDIALHSLQMGYFNPFHYLRFYRFLKQHRFDAVCDFGGDFGGLPVFCASAAKISRRLIFYRNARNAYTNTKAKLLYQALLNRVARRFSTHILSNSQEAFDFYYRHYPVAGDQRFQIIRNGIPVGSSLSAEEKAVIRSEIGISPNQKLVLHVGSGRSEKNHSVMFKMAEWAQKHADHACFCFAGPSVEENHETAATAMGLRNVRFLGERRDIDQLLQAADIFLFPSLSEGQPNALLEAIINGVPFIASTIAPIKECLPPTWGERWLFAPDDLEQGVTLLQQHLNNDLRQDKEFRDLVAWFNKNYNEDKQFGRFLDVLTCGQNTKNR